MRLVHLSDIHLGFRQYERQTPAGKNQREADVATTLRTVIDKVIEIHPDLVLIAGDVFHAVRPTNPAILHAFQQFSRLVQSLPESTVVMVAGNHDTPRTAESVSILRLFSSLGINVVEGNAKRFTLHEQDVSILAVPDMEGVDPPFPIDPTAKYNVLVIHGEVEGVIPRYMERLDRAPMKISQRALAAEKWDYIALGHYHVYRPVLPHAFYSGSIDYTSTNPWGEMVEEKESGKGGKGIIEHDLATKTHKFHPIPPVRRWVDLPPISGAGLSPAALDAAIREAVEQCEGGIEDKIVRLVVSDVPRHIVRDLDHKTIREFKRKALHFNLDTRRPEIMRPKVGQAAPGRRASLADTVREKLQTRVLTENIDRTALVELGLYYLREADTVAGAAVDEGTL
ncbi:MAG: DNA repair exonuclease [Gemmatimonadaceae bacterium]